jgi:hypothetical protein
MWFVQKMSLSESKHYFTGHAKCSLYIGRQISLKFLEFVMLMDIHQGLLKQICFHIDRSLCFTRQSWCIWIRVKANIRWYFKKFMRDISTSKAVNYKAQRQSCMCGVVMSGMQLKLCVFPHSEPFRLMGLIIVIPLPPGPSAHRCSFVVGTGPRVV